ncbi:hypothetical protein EVAR_93004_1 [Eumeta japonica]|uniref:Uncharacterized protein n=1 Tax=Eumeta variegata TaxID=151549 RepID=A0A4C1TAJ2_EUMVA|nr:hypothetical protein EVAR_93004_1 [Eumeta japonica]
MTQISRAASSGPPRVLTQRRRYSLLQHIGGLVAGHPGGDLVPVPVVAQLLSLQRVLESDSERQMPFLSLGGGSRVALVFEKNLNPIEFTY